MVAVTSQQGQQAARPSVQGLSVDSRKLTQGELRLPVILDTMSVFVLAQNQANIPRQSLSFSEASTAKLEFLVKNRPNPHATSSFRVEVVKPYTYQVRRQSNISLVGLSILGTHARSYESQGNLKSFAHE